MKSFLNPKQRILVTGGAGFLGRYVVRQLVKEGIPSNNILIPRSKNCDLRMGKHCEKIVKKIDIVIHLAAKVGGIGYNAKHPAEMFYDNIMIGSQLMHEAWRAKVKKFVAVGTICCYPKFTKVPFVESDLWEGYPEETNAPYGLAKKMLLVQSQAYRKQYNFNSIFLLPVNLFGPGDNFSPKSSHVIPAMISKIWKAKQKHKKQIVLWGSGKVTREFLYAEDAASGIISATKWYNEPEPVNLGSGYEISIRDLALQIASFINFTGKIYWDSLKPEGQPRRLVDVSRAKEKFNFVAKMDFKKGLQKMIRSYCQVIKKNEK